MKWFIFAITAMGIIRFIVKYYSMSAIIMAGAFCFAIARKTHTERLKAAYLLILPYMTIEVLALGYTWATGQRTICHSAEYSMGTSSALHTVGHLAGGLMWEPLLLFAAMEIVWYWAR